MTTPIEPTDGRTLQRQLAAQLRHRIVTGNLEPGDQLPSQAELRATYRVSDNTIRAAIEALRDEGLVETVRGKGVFVREKPPERRVSSDRYADQLAALQTNGEHRYESAFTRDLGIEWDQFTVDCDFGEVPATGTVADYLQIDVGTPVFRRHMVMRASGRAERIQTSYYPLDLVAGTAMTDPDRQPVPGGVIAELAGLGVTITATDEHVRTRMPTPDESYLLRIAGGVPVLVLIRVGHSETRPVEVVTDMVLPGDRYVLHYHIDL